MSTSERKARIAALRKRLAKLASPDQTNVGSPQQRIFLNAALYLANEAILDIFVETSLADFKRDPILSQMMPLMEKLARLDTMLGRSLAPEDLSRSRGLRRQFLALVR